MKKILLVALLWVSASYAVLAQDAQFSQYYQSYLFLNPAVAGIEQDITLSTAFRSQWRSISTPFSTSQISFIAPIYVGDGKPVQLGGVGASLINDQAGDGSLRTMGFMLTGALSKSLKDDLHRFSFAAQAGVLQRSIDFTNLQWGEQWSNYRGFDPTTPVNISPNINTKINMPLINGGVMYAFNPAKNYMRKRYNFQTGVAVANLNQPNQAFIEGQTSKLPLLLRYHLNAEFEVSRHTSIGPSLLVLNQQKFSQVNLGGYLTYALGPDGLGSLAHTDLVFGMWYRLQDAIIYSVMLQSPTYSIGFSYDVNNSSLQRFTNNRGAYELTFTFKNNRDSRKPRRYDTPRL